MAPNSSPSPELNDGGIAGATYSGGGGAHSRRRAAARPKLRYVLIMAGAGLVAYIFDQLTKWWVVSTMIEGEKIEVLPPILSWHFIRNSGAAFSIGEDVTWIFTIIQAAVPLMIFWFSRKLGSVWWSIAFGLLAGGALGNLTDRLFREPSFGMGHVVDFIGFPNFAIFNIADSSVVGAVILICILTFKGIGIDGRRDEPEPASANTADNSPGDNSPGGDGPGDDSTDNDRPGENRAEP